MIMKKSHDGYEIAERDLALRGPGDFLRSNSDSSMRQSGGLRFKLAELCEDEGLFRTAFDEARALLEADRELEGYPRLRASVEGMFTIDRGTVN